jgi:hypothetical protein
VDDGADQLAMVVSLVRDLVGAACDAKGPHGSRARHVQSLCHHCKAVDGALEFLDAMKDGEVTPRIEVVTQ